MDNSNKKKEKERISIWESAEKLARYLKKVEFMPLYDRRGVQPGTKRGKYKKDWANKE